jgi:hypothetical protein
MKNTNLYGYDEISIKIKKKVYIIFLHH